MTTLALPITWFILGTVALTLTIFFEESRPTPWQVIIAYIVGPLAVVASVIILGIWIAAEMVREYRRG